MVWLVKFAEALPALDGCVVAVGNFDGVHAGHRSLLALAKAEALALALPLVVLTFEPHPRSVLRPEMALKRLSTVEEKVDLLGEVGVDGVAVLPFDIEVAGWSPARFVDEVLLRWLGAKCVWVGENFKFGHRAQGDVAFLRAQTRFTTRAAPLLTDATGVVSSSRLRGH